MKKIFFLALILFSSINYSQQRKFIKGDVFYRKLQLLEGMTIRDILELSKSEGIVDDINGDLETLKSKLNINGQTEGLFFPDTFYYQKGDYAGAQTVLNALRAAVDLDPLPTTTDKAKVMEYLLHETFAELWVEGRRMSYLHRWGKTAEIFKPINDANNLRPLPRPSKFPMSYSEATYNTQIDNSLSSRCLPMSGS